ncbi:MAG: hypothetical protein QM711_06090 [Micropruina sp.]|uniref:hypothetical protein n=1 Tax=Micropruina sp. TaxID=2737536 RepID=UPI0039E48F02
MSGRKLLADALRAALPTWQVLSHTGQLDSVRQPGAVVLWTSRRTRAPKLGLDWFADEVELWVLTATDKPALIEDDLDALLLAVMQALEPLGSFAWETAERAVLADVYDGYRMTITCMWRVQEEENP